MEDSEGFHPGIEVCAVERHRDLSDGEGGIIDIPAPSLSVSGVEAAIGCGCPGRPSEPQLTESAGSPSLGGREQKAQVGRTHSVADYQPV